MQPLDDIGNPDAPRGSRDWCSALRLQAQVEISDAKTRVSNLRWSLKPFRDEGFYKTLTDQNGQPFTSWEQFCQYKRPWGLNLPAEVASAVINENDLNKDLATVAAEVMKRVEAKPEQKIGKGKAGPGRGHKTGYDITRFERGVSATYLASRIKRDHPDLAAAVERGEYKSIHAAAVVAGLVPKTVRVILDPECAAKILRKHLSLEDRQRLSALLIE